MNRHIDPAKKNEQILLDLLKIESNKYCADCGQKGTRWASWNIGVFLCIRCGGLHRSLGTHISKVKSVTLDKWTDEQIESIKAKGNYKVNNIYNPNSDKHPFPTFSGDMDNYIRDKYERKLFLSDSSQLNLSLKEKENSKNNLIDSEFSYGCDDSNTFKDSFSDFSTGPNYSKQLLLLSEMGFTDHEFNFKTLKAANGNMQDVLEIIVAANQKQKRKIVENNIFDEIEQVNPVLNSSLPLDNVNEKISVLMDDWGHSDGSKEKIAKKSLSPVTIKDKYVDEKMSVETNISSNHNNPWDNSCIEQRETETQSASEIELQKKIEDPFDTYKSFKTSSSDNYFDNPW